MWQQVAFAVLLVIATFDNFDAYPSDYYSPLQQGISYVSDEYRTPFGADRQSLDHFLLGGQLKRMHANSGQISRLFEPRPALDSVNFGFGRTRKNQDHKEQARYSRTLNSLVLGGGFKRSGLKLPGNDKQNPELEESYLNRNNGDDKQQESETYRSPAYYLYRSISPSSYQNL